jgi:DNA (cytosine-5)-methyltransferase 1
MAEIAAMPLNGLAAASTFAGGGGTSTGLRMAGFKVLWANECDPHAVETYRANHPDTELDPRDVREVTAADIMRAVGGREIDLLDGSPPCTAFSTAGKREKGWGKRKSHAGRKQDRVEDLFFEYARLLRDLQPRAFVAENVSGLITTISIYSHVDVCEDSDGCEARRADSEDDEEEEEGDEED